MIPLCHSTLSRCTNTIVPNSRDAKQNYLLSFLIKRNQVQCVSNNYFLSHAWLSGIVEKRRGFRTPCPLFLWGLEDRWVNIEGSKLKEQSCQSSLNCSSIIEFLSSLRIFPWVIFLRCCLLFLLVFTIINIIYFFSSWLILLLLPIKKEKEEKGTINSDIQRKV